MNADYRRRWLPRGNGYAGDLKSNLPKIIADARRMRAYVEIVPTEWYDDCGLPHPVGEVKR